MAQLVQIFYILALQAVLFSVTFGASLVRDLDQVNIKPPVSELGLQIESTHEVDAVKPPTPLHDGSGDDLFEGDILGINLKGLSQAEIIRLLHENEFQNETRLMLNFGNNGIIGANYRWPGIGIMPYYIDPNFDSQERTTILSAISEINQKTNVYIRPYATTDTDYVYIKKGNVNAGCSSYVGRQSGGQYLTLEAACLRGNGGKGTAIHELMHALGFHHEQARTDRDTYVSVYKSNIIPDKYEVNFKTYVSNTYNQPYDYSSIMHYRKDAFAINKNAISISPKAPYTHCSIGQTNGLSAIDIAKINSMYPGSAGTPARLPIGCELFSEYNVRIRLSSYSNPNNYVFSGSKCDWNFYPECDVRFDVTYTWQSSSRKVSYGQWEDTTTIYFSDSYGLDIKAPIYSNVAVTIKAYDVDAVSEEHIGTYIFNYIINGSGTATLYDNGGGSSGSYMYVKFQSY